MSILEEFEDYQNDVKIKKSFWTQHKEDINTLFKLEKNVLEIYKFYKTKYPEAPTQASFYQFVNRHLKSKKPRAIQRPKKEVKNLSIKKSQPSKSARSAFQKTVEFKDF